jgi:RND family efflux transporter MFP subunit
MKTPKPTWAAAALLLAALAPLEGCNKAMPAGPSEAAAGPDAPVRVKTVKPTRGPFQRTTAKPLPAQVAAYDKTDVFAKASGYLEKFAEVRGADGKPRPLDIGDRVQEGDILAELWIPEAQQDLVQKEKLLKQAESELEQAAKAVDVATKTAKAAADKAAETRALVDYARAEEEFRKSEYDRYARLLNERTASPEQVAEKLKQSQAASAAVRAAEAAVVTAQSNVEVEQAKAAKARADLKNAEARVEVATANRDQAKILLGYGRVTAPYAGVVTRRWVDAGAFVQSAAATAKPEPVFTLMRTDKPMRVVADVSEADAPLVRVGLAATLAVDGLTVDGRPAKPLPGKVVRIADALDPMTRTMRTEVEVDEAKVAKEEQPALAGLRPGMFGSLVVVLEDHPDALLLPAGVLMTAGGKTSVWVVEDDRARLREIEVGSNDGVRVHVTGKLQAEEQVIGDGKNLVHEGQLVEVVK